MNHWKSNDFSENLVVVNRSDTYCGNCGKGATFRETHHNSVLSWSDEERAKPGCGTEWKYIASDYVGLKMKERCEQLRPDLEWKGFDEEKLRREIEEANASKV